MKFQEKSYERHATQYQQYLEGGEHAIHGNTWRSTDTVDAWRHQRMYRTMDPLLESGPGADWLTVGDGRYGNDAHYILEHGGTVLATDIADGLLAKALADGFISAYRMENVEALSFADGTFDYVLCKESYHHFPRPMLALYEMLRVARTGVVLIEPNDAHVAEDFRRVLWRSARGLYRRSRGKPDGRNSFEESGNYLYGISRREIEKVALGLNYWAVAFKGLNDVYYSGVEFEKLSANGPLQRRVRRKIAFLDVLCACGVGDYGILAAIIFKHPPPESTLVRLRGAGYAVSLLPRNPYIVED